MDRWQVVGIEVRRAAGVRFHGLPGPKLLWGSPMGEQPWAGRALDADGQRLVDERMRADEHRDSFERGILVLPRCERMVTGEEVSTRRHTSVEPGDLGLGNGVDPGDDDRLQEGKVVPGITGRRVVTDLASGPEAADASREAVHGVRAIDLSATTEVQQPARGTGVQIAVLRDHHVALLHRVAGEPGVTSCRDRYPIRGRRSGAGRAQSLEVGRRPLHEPHRGDRGRDVDARDGPDGLQLFRGDPAEEAAHVVRSDQPVGDFQGRT